MSGYCFHANVLAVGGAVMFGNKRATIPSLASVVLPSSGGEGYAVSDGYDENGVAFTRAESRVVGAEIAEGIFYTYSDVLITNFTVFDRLNIPRLRIALMGAQMTTTRNLEMEESQFELRLSYRGIVIDGAEVEPVLDVALCNAATFGDVATTLNHDLEGYAERFGIAAPSLQTALANVGASQSLHGALVRGFRTPEGALTTGCALPVPNVGRAHFGEFTFKPGDRRVKLFRLKVQSGMPGGAESIGGDEGEVVGGSLEGNGTPPVGG